MNIGKDRLKKSLKYSILDGAFDSAMIGFGESFFSAFAIFMKATNTQLSLLISFPLFIGSFFELYSLKLLKIFKSRKLMVLTGVFFQALIYVLIFLSYFMGYNKVYYLILFSSIYYFFALIISPVWNSWIADLVHKNERGSFFGLRNEISGFFSFFAFILAGFILDYFSKNNNVQYYGYLIIFLLAIFSRAISFVFLFLQYEPKFTIEEDNHLSFFTFVKNAKRNNFGILVLYISVINFALYLAAPFFTAYMLKDLSFSYFRYTLLMGIIVIVKYLSMPIWGSISDSYGTRKVLSIGGFFISSIPILWLFSSNIWYLVLIQIFGGFVFAAYEISAVNFLYDATTPKTRVSLIAYNNVISGFALLFGSLFGALIINYNFLFKSDYLFVFLVSGIIRFLAALYFIPKLKEVRRVENVSYSRLFLKIIKLMPSSGGLHKIITLNWDNKITNKDK